MRRTPANARNSTLSCELILSFLIQERDRLNRAIEVLQGSAKRRGRPPKNAFIVAPAAPKKRKAFNAKTRKKDGPGTKETLGRAENGEVVTSRSPNAPSRNALSAAGRFCHFGTRHSIRVAPAWVRQRAEVKAARGTERKQLAGPGRARAALRSLAAAGTRAVSNCRLLTSGLKVRNALEEPNEFDFELLWPSG
jgi:hypothetical protein